MNADVSGNPADGGERAHPTVTGVILAGGSSRRMGRDKALLPLANGSRGEARLIEIVYQRLAPLCDQMAVVAKDPERYDFLPCMRVNDVLDGTGALVGIHAALTHCRTRGVFVVGCDMPRLQPALLQHIINLGARWQVVVPDLPSGLEPLHAWYSRDCLATIEAQLARGERKISRCFEQLQTRRLVRTEIRQFDPQMVSCTNVNTPDELAALDDSPGRQNPPRPR